MALLRSRNGDMQTPRETSRPSSAQHSAFEEIAHVDRSLSPQTSLHLSPRISVRDRDTAVFPIPAYRDAIMKHKIAIVWRGDPASRVTATPENNRYRQIFSELLALGIEAEPAVYCEERQDEFRAQLMKADGALVWVNPLDGGRT